MKNLLNYALLISLMVPSIIEKAPELPKTFFSTTKVIANYSERGYKKAGLIINELNNGLWSYKFVGVDSLDNIIVDKTEHKELSELRKKMIIGAITKEYSEFNIKYIQETGKKINPKNNFEFDYKNLEKTIESFLKFEERYGLDWKTAVAHSLKESICNQFPYGALDELGPFHIREKTAKDIFKYVKKKFSEDEYAQKILGKEFDKEKLKEPEHSLLFYLAIMNTRLRCSNSIDEALRKYNAGIYSEREEAKEYSRGIKRNLEILDIYEAYSRENPKGFAFFYLMTMFPYFKDFSAEYISVEEEFWSNKEDPLESIYSWIEGGGEQFWRKNYPEKYLGRLSTIMGYKLGDVKERGDRFFKHYGTAYEFVKKSTEESIRSQSSQHR